MLSSLQGTLGDVWRHFQLIHPWKGEEGPGMLLKILPYTEQSPTTKNYLASTVNSVTDEKSYPRHQHSYFQVIFLG